MKMEGNIEDDHYDHKYTDTAGYYCITGWNASITCNFYIQCRTSLDWLYQDSLDQYQMLINADQYWSELHYWSQWRSIKTNADQCRTIHLNWLAFIGIERYWEELVSIDQNWEVYLRSIPIGIDRYWFTLGIDRRNPFIFAGTLPELHTFPQESARTRYSTCTLCYVWHNGSFTKGGFAKIYFLLQGNNENLPLQGRGPQKIQMLMNFSNLHRAGRWTDSIP